MSAPSRGSPLTGVTDSKRGVAGPFARGRMWRGSSGRSQPPGSTDDSTRGARSRGAGRGGPRGGRGRRGDIAGGITHSNGTSNRSTVGYSRGSEKKNPQDGSRLRNQENGVKSQVFSPRPVNGQTSRSFSPFGAISNTGSIDRSRDPRRKNDNFGEGGSAKFGMPQDYNSRYEQLKLDRAKQRTQAIRSGQMADPNQPVSLNSAITPTGTCTEMCPEFERVERIVQKMVDKSEKFIDPESGLSQTVEDKMLKRFRRSAAGYDEQLPSDIRTPKTLLQTMNYLLRHVVEDDETLALTHKFLWDRTRSIRNDLSIQQVTQAQDVEIAVKCLERIARFHIVSLHLLSSPDNSEPFDHHQEREQLNNTLLSLLYYYDDNRDLIKFPNEDEFRAYYIVFSIHDQRPDLESRVQKWPRELLRSPRVQVALELFAAAGNTWEYQGTLDAKRPNAIAQGLYSRFFRLIQSDSVPYLLACIAEIYFNQVRQTAIRSIWKAYCRHPLSQQSKNQEWTVDDLTEVLAFDDNDQTIEFCEEQDLQLATNADGQMYLNWGQRPLDSVAFRPSSQQTFSYEYVESKRCGRTLVALILGMNVVQAARRGMIDEALLSQSYAVSQPGLELKDDGGGLFVSDDEDAHQVRDAKTPKSESRNGIMGTSKPVFSIPPVEEPNLGSANFSQGGAGGPFSYSVPSTQQPSSPWPGTLSPAAPVFTPQVQSPFSGFGKPSTFGAPQQQTEQATLTPQLATGLGVFGQPSRNPFSPSESAPQSKPPTFSTFGANLGSSFGSSFGSSSGVSKDTQQPQAGDSTPSGTEFKLGTSAISFGQPSSSQLGNGNSSQGFSQAAPTPSISPYQPKETTSTEKPLGASDGAKPRERLFGPFPGAQSAKQPSTFGKGTTTSPFASSGTFGQPSKDTSSAETSAPTVTAPMFSTSGLPSFKQDQPATTVSNIFSSPFSASVESSAFKTPAPQFGFANSVNKPQEPNPGGADDDQKAAELRAAEQEAAKWETVEEKKREEEMEARRIESEKREAARREIERECERRRAAAEEAARLERLERARKEEEELQRAKRLEEERIKTAKREATLQEMARRQEAELRASQLEIERREAAEREIVREEAARRELIEQEIAKRKADFAEEEDEGVKEQYIANGRMSEGILTVEELLSLNRSSTKPKLPPPPATSKPLIDEDELLFSAARLAASDLANGKHLWADIPGFQKSLSMSMSTPMSTPMSPASTSRFSRSSTGPESSRAPNSSHILVNGYDVALAPETRLGLGRTLSRTEQRIRQTGAKGLASLPIASSAASSKLSNGKVRKNKHKRQKRGESS
ncbi:hypothetical protein ACO22_07558 [Paracoccidioides brasiliensis]|uniref:Uncharacterized protein n=1 Tax=Paracoccidioides brasiliensis TaxID=121759 RepID=A0A1D2J4B8_PARBR|nr:hypothetical protein ACO22_07558 [Paracoccidioides brasiliensis]ODH51660.1 hypothetical protein GX48_02125 [Paracoccidioides brasiliensis]